MELRDILPRDDIAARVDEGVLFSEFTNREMDEICSRKTKSMLDVGSSIGYRLKLLNPGLNLEQFSGAFDGDDPYLFSYIATVVGARTLLDVHYWHVELEDDSPDYRTVSEFLVAVCSPNVLHIADLEFSNPRRPIALAQRSRLMTRYKGLGLLGALTDRCIAFAGEKRLDAICLTPAAHDLVPVFEAVGFVLDDNALAQQMREAGMPGPMSLRVYGRS